MPLDAFRIVLTRPLYGGNVGSVCRAMMNMGFSRLAVVEPTNPLDEVELRKMALSAVSIYENRSEHPTLADAVTDCHVVAGTSARLGMYRSHSRTLREWVPDMLRSAAAGPVALAFGPEDDGLSNDEIALCNRIIQIPTTDAYKSLNLSQAVLLCCYELYVGTESFEPTEESSREATSSERERMFEVWRHTLLNIGFMHDQTADHMMLGLRRILSRGILTDKDVRILMGIARQSNWNAEELKKRREE